MKIRAYSFITMFALAMLFSPTASANLLLNGDFEAGTLGSGPDDWLTFNFTSSSVLTDSTAQSGTNSLLESGATATTGSTGAFQVVQGGASPGDVFKVSVWAKIGGLPYATDDSNSGASVALIAEQLGGADTLSEIFPIAPLLTTDWQKFTFTSTAAPALTAQFKVQLNSRHIDQTIHFDNASVILVPEPTSLALLGLAGLGTLVIRRRS